MSPIVSADWRRVQDSADGGGCFEVDYRRHVVIDLVAELEGVPRLGNVTAIVQELREQCGPLNSAARCGDPPAAFTVLNAQELPPSDTVFLDMRAAYDLLAPEMQKRLQGLRAVYGYNNHNAFPPRVSACGLNDALEDVIHPIVRTHPVTGRRALYIDLDRATHVEGMAIDAGRACCKAYKITPSSMRPVTLTGGGLTMCWHGQRVGAAQGERRFPDW